MGDARRRTGRAGRAVRADRALDRGRRRRPDRRRHRDRRPRRGDRSISTCATAWAMHSGTGRASGRPSSRAAARRPSIAGPPSSRSPMSLQGQPPRPGRSAPCWPARAGAAAGRFVGDDLPDLPVLRAVGLAACPADAVAEVRDAAHLVTRAPGGRGAVREVIEVILKGQGLWHGLCSGYSLPAI